MESDPDSCPRCGWVFERGANGRMTTRCPRPLCRKARAAEEYQVRRAREKARELRARRLAVAAALAAARRSGRAPAPPPAPRAKPPRRWPSGPPPAAGRSQGAAGAAWLAIAAQRFAQAGKVDARTLAAGARQLGQTVRLEP